MNLRALQNCFEIETATARGSEPRVIFTGRIRGASHRIEVRLPEPLRARLRTYAPTCHTIAVMALAQQSLIRLIETKQRLMSHWLPDGEAGEFFHVLASAKRGQPHVECGSLPSRSKSGGRAPTAVISIPDALHDALQKEARHVSNALAALADWQLDLLIDERRRIMVNPQ